MISEPIAIVGMSVRVPGAADLQQFWRNLARGVESITPATREELLARGADPAMIDDPGWVNATAFLEGFDEFDAPLFGMTGREAEITDPQQRLFLEACHATLTDAGYDPARYAGAIGVYGGTGSPGYFHENLMRNRRIVDSQHGGIEMATGNMPSYLTSSVSYKLNLRGPSLSVHTACSTSLVAVHLACEALRNGECDMALAGGVNVEMPHGTGYLGVDGFTSPDGHVRAFDARANGTVWSSGVGVILVKRLSDAVADGDVVRAVVLGNAINNDGATKVGFSAPSVAGQIEAIAQAVGVAGVDPRTIGYVEAHGTGTALGDPIEITALSTVYGAETGDTQWCAIGSVKSNIGHLSQAAGVVSLIKAALALESGLIPPTVNYSTPNPAIDFPSSPFYPVRTMQKWQAGDGPRRAGVSSFGVGGTNAHVILEQAPERAATEQSRPVHLLRVSAHGPEALAEAVERLADGLAAAAKADLADVAHTLSAGRAEHPHRAVVVARDVREAVAALRDSRRLSTGTAQDTKVAFLFSGQGSQYAGMGAELYRAEPEFAAAVDECAKLLGTADLFDRDLRETRHAQPALFVLEYALARLWGSWGVTPAAMIGHSIGEYVAATLAGVFELEDALRLVVRRGELMQAMPPGAMVAVQLDEASVAKSLPAGLAVASVNGPGTCVVAGPVEDVEDFTATLRATGVQCKELETSHAFHSPMMEPAVAEFVDAVAEVPRRAPSKPFLSNVTGDWITDAQATDPGYWASHLRMPVRFGDCVRTLFADGGRWALVECGPGHQLAGLARGQVPRDLPAPQPSLPARGDRAGDVETVSAAAGLLWTEGVPVGRVGPPGRRVRLPGYPYQRRRYWVDADPAGVVAVPERPAGPLPLSEWFAVPVWRQAEPDLRAEPFGSCLLFSDDDVLPELLRAAGVLVTVVRSGDAFAAAGAGFVLRPGVRADYDQLLSALGERPERIVHAFALSDVDDSAAVAQERGFFSLLNLVQTFGTARIDLVSTGTADVTGADLTRPEHATLAGIARVVPLESPGTVVRWIDAEPELDGLVAELCRPADAATEVVLRAGRRWVLGYAQATVPTAEPVLKDRGRYLITGGTGGIGLTLAEDFARRTRARLILLSRNGRSNDRAARTTQAVRRMEAAGSVVHVIAADVTDPAALRAAREVAEAEFGGLDGIVHAAGLPGGGLAEVKDRAAAESVLAPKIAGVEALAEVFADLPMDFVALCSSVTAVSGDFGQVDYCAANNFLDAYARSAHGWRARVVAHDWGGWDEIGMAAEIDAPTAVRSGRSRALGPVEHPVLTTRTDHGCHGPVSANSHWLLDEHRIGGVPVVPGTGHLETVRAAFEAVRQRPGTDHVVELRDVAFLEPFAVPDGVTGEYRVSFTGDEFTVTSRVTGVTRTHVRGSARWIPAPAPSTVDFAAITARCRLLDDEEALGRTSMVTFGPRWTALRTHHLGATEELAQIVAPHAATSDLDEWVLHPALLDVATAFGRGRGNGTYLPMAYGRIVVRGSLPATFHSHLTYQNSAGDQVITADLKLCDDNGRVLVDIEDFVLRRVDGDAVAGDLTTKQAASAGESDGIRPVDGAEAFLRALTPGLGQRVVISPRPVADLFAGRVTAESVVEERTEVEVEVEPDDGDHVAPRTELEAEIARIWAEVLGVRRIGVHDDFFTHGGNSLVAIQLVAQVRKHTGLQVAVSTLFDAPTVAVLAERIEELRTEAKPALTIPRLGRA